MRQDIDVTGYVKPYSLFVLAVIPNRQKGVCPP